MSHRVAVVGNAAQSLHPIAGQGFNLGLRDVITLAQTVSAAFQRGQDIGAIPVLMDYASQRQPDRDTTVALTSGSFIFFLIRVHYLQPHGMQVWG